MKRSTFTAAFLSLGIGLGISSCNSCDSGKYGKMSGEDLQEAILSQKKNERISDCENVHQWGMTGSMRAQLKDTCKGVCNYKSGNYPAAEIARSARENGADVETARELWEWSMGETYGPRGFGTADVATFNNSGGDYAVEGCSYAVKSMDFKECNATAVFTFRIKDDEGHRYRVKQTMKFDFAITDLDAAETEESEDKDPRNFTGWLPSLNHPFGVADEEIFKGGKKKGRLQKLKDAIFGDLGVQKAPVRFLHRNRAASAGNVRAGPAPQSRVQSRLARAARG